MTPRRFVLPVCIPLLLLAATAVHGQLVEPTFTAEDDALITPLVVQYARLALYVGVPAMLGAIVALALLGVGSRGAESSAGAGFGPQLPVELRSVNVLGARYDLDTYSGIVTAEKTVVDQTTTTTVQVQGGTYGYGYMPWSTTSTTTTTRTNIVWLRYPDGSEGVWSFTNNDFHVAVGQVVSLVTRRNKKGKHECVLAYNHSGGQTERFSLLGIHRLGMISWLAATAAGVAVLMWVVPQFVAAAMNTLGPDHAWTRLMQSSTLSYLTPVTVISAVVALVAYLVALAVFVQLRERMFRARHQPGIRAFLQASTGTLKQQFASPP